VRLAAEIGSGLDALHRQNVIHRDVKAPNILLTQEGTAMLTDFGLAKGRAYTVLTRPGGVMGTIDYLAPELIRGEPASEASDLYALACTVYECASGRTPFAAGSSFQVGLSHLQDEPPDPGRGRDDWSAALSMALLQGLAKDRESRPPNASAFARALQAAADARSG
jgi:serine/threonine-protein kinase